MNQKVKLQKINLLASAIFIISLFISLFNSNLVNSQIQYSYQKFALDFSIANLTKSSDNKIWFNENGDVSKRIGYFDTTNNQTKTFQVNNINPNSDLSISSLFSNTKSKDGYTYYIFGEELYREPNSQQPQIFKEYLLKVNETGEQEAYEIELPDLDYNCGKYVYRLEEALDGNFWLLSGKFDGGENCKSYIHKISPTGQVISTVDKNIIRITSVSELINSKIYVAGGFDEQNNVINSLLNLDNNQLSQNLAPENKCNFPFGDEKNQTNNTIYFVSYETCDINRNEGQEFDTSGFKPTIYKVDELGNIKKYPVQNTIISDLSLDDSESNLWFSSMLNNSISRLNLTTGDIDTFQLPEDNLLSSGIISVENDTLWVSASKVTDQGEQLNSYLYKISLINEASLTPKSPKTGNETIIIISTILTLSLLLLTTTVITKHYLKKHSQQNTK